jgi:hypothetical protein
MSGAGRRLWPVPIRDSSAPRESPGYSRRNVGSPSEEDTEGLAEFRKYAVFRPTGVAKAAFRIVNLYG